MRRHANRAACSQLDQSTPHQPPHQAPFPSMSASPQYHGEGWKRKPGLMRVYSTSEKLRWERKNQVEKGLRITRNKEGLVGWRWKGTSQKGLLSLGARRGPIGGCGLPAVQPGWGQGVAWAEPPRDGREVGFSTKINTFEFRLR